MNNRSLLVKFSFLAFVFVQMSCSDDSIDPQSKIPQSIQPLLMTFLDEAENRNVLIDTANLEVLFVDQLSDNQAGLCGLGFFDYNGTGSNRIEILENSTCWAERSDVERENFFFHEMGHAVLGRAHIEDKLLNGVDRSLMCGRCNNFEVYNDFTLFKRKYYLDELFNTETPSPDWGNIKTIKSTLLAENFDIGDLDWVFEVSDGTSNNNNYTGDLVDSRFVSGPHSLLISAQTIVDTHASAKWKLTLRNPNIAPFSNLILKCQIRSESIQGVGANIAIAGFSEEGSVSELILYDTTLKSRNILGSQPFTSYQINYLCYPEDIDRLEIHFEIQPNTIGQIYLDDVELIVNR